MIGRRRGDEGKYIRFRRHNSFPQRRNRYDLVAVGPCGSDASIKR